MGHPANHAMRAARIGGVAAFALAGALAFLLSGYALFQATQILIYAIAILGLNLLMGYNGQISLGHGAFYAIGGYAAAICINHFGMPYWATIPVAAVTCLVVGYLIGLPALRLEPLYLALVTFAVAVAVPQLLKYKGLEQWTGGVQGLMVDKPAAPAFLRIDDDQWLYLLTLLCGTLLLVLAHNLVRGRIGRALMAIKEHPIAADTMGIDAPRYKSVTFGISALFTGVAGALAALASQFVSPETYSFFLSITILVGSVVGGMTSIIGPIFGAAFIVLMPNLAEQFSKSAAWAIYGLFLIAFMYLMPTGVTGLIGRIRARIGR